MQPKRGEGERGKGAPGGEEIVLGPPLPPNFILKAPKFRDRGKLPAAEGGEQMLSAHSRKLDTGPPAAHQLSHRGPPLAPTGSPMARWGAGSVPVSSARGRGRQPQRRATVTPSFGPKLSLTPF